MKRKKPDETVFQMWIGEGLFFVICEVVGLFFVKQRLHYTIGLFLGVLLAMGSTYHIWWVLDTALDFDEKTAGKMIGSRYLYRYIALIVLIAVLYVTGIGNAFATFLGYMSLKIGAYLAPLIDKVKKRRG